MDDGKIGQNNLTLEITETKKILESRPISFTQTNQQNTKEAMDLLCLSQEICHNQELAPRRLSRNKWSFASSTKLSLSRRDR